MGIHKSYFLVHTFYLLAGILGLSPAAISSVPELLGSNPQGALIAQENLNTPSSEIIELEFLPLDAWRNPQLLRTIDAHSGPVDVLTFTADNQFLISGGSRNDAHLKVWWLETGREVDSIRAHRTSITALALTPDGEILASVGDDAGVNLWEWQQGNYTRTFLDHSSNILSLAITPDSKTLVTGALDGIRLWDLQKQRPLYILNRFDHQTYALAINPEGSILASGHKFGTIKLWNLKTGTLLGTIPAHTGASNQAPGRSNRSVSVLAYTPDGNILVSGSYDRTIKVWNQQTTGQLAYPPLRGHTGPIEAIAIHPNGEIIASASRDGVRLWNLQTGELLALLRGHGDWVKSLAFSHDGRLLATGGFDQSIRIWQVMSVISSSDKLSKN
ncbi:MAG: WD40 repeat domain-containing protein [Symploca sp. SIO2E6]|nr:WD40 repeat domain-containing protein [Symploca sp. SIO2E6]